ncbi:MAG TPA: VTT domain-containing protein [Candidatus Nanoarchaeia archaeon]|nr:VTT domain-containing protein [Candidatus Nanoarchaeia archaeon]
MKSALMLMDVSKIKYHHIKDYVRRRAIFLSISLVVIISAIFLFVIFQYSQVESSIRHYITAYGFIAIFVIAFFLDAIEQPIGPELPLLAGIASGLDVIGVAVFTILGSSLASFLSYYLGRKYGDYGFRKIYGDKLYYKWRERYLKRSELVLALAALTPVPFVLICWISGIFRMKFLYFVFFGTVVRAAKIVMYAYLIDFIL